MLNREIQIREKLEKINVNNYIARGIVWKVTKYGAYLKAKKIHKNDYTPDVQLKDMKNGNNFHGSFAVSERIQGPILSRKQNKDRMPSLANVYDDEAPFYYQCITKKPFSGPVSKFNPNLRKKQGLYKILKRNKDAKH
jgi:hypothetical protein